MADGAAIVFFGDGGSATFELHMLCILGAMLAMPPYPPLPPCTMCGDPTLSLSFCGQCWAYTHRPHAAAQTYTHNCVISLEPIELGGMTCFGNVYDYRAIKRWLADHATDPATNELLPTRFIVKIYGTAFLAPAELAARGAEMRASTGTWWLASRPPISRAMRSAIHVEGRRRRQIRAWRRFRARVATVIAEMPARTVIADLPGTCGAIDRLWIQADRPGTGGSLYSQSRDRITFDYLKMASVTLLTFKGVSFIGATFIDAVLSECTFSDCAFTSANMTRAVFVGCRFTGATMFDGAYASGGNGPQFVNCYVEGVAGMLAADVTALLKLRRLRCPFTVVDAAAS